MYLYVVYCLYGQCGSFLHNYWVWWCRCWVWVEMPSSRYTPATTLSSLRPAPLHCIHITRIKHHLIDFIEHAWAALLETIFIWPEKLYLWFSLKPQCYNLHRNGCPFIINRTRSELLPIKPNDGWWWWLCHCLPLLQFPGLWSRTSLLHPFDCVPVNAESAELEHGVLPMARVQAPH